MRLLVTGSRDWWDWQYVWKTLDSQRKAAFESPNEFVLVVGDCPTGLDYWARRWANFNMASHEIFRADWITHGKAAGPIRNQAMVDSGADKCLAFILPGKPCKGTRDCAKRARDAGIPTWWIGKNPDEAE